VCIIWTNKELNIINVHSATMKILTVMLLKTESSGVLWCRLLNIIDFSQYCSPFSESRVFTKYGKSIEEKACIRLDIL
jgi:hypothetical protein